MPFRTLYASSVRCRWIPTIIDAYRALKIKNINLIIHNTAASSTISRIAIGFDKAADVAAPQLVGDHSVDINILVELVIDSTLVVELDPIDKIIGDFIELATDSVVVQVSAIVFYEEIKTKFDQYGQVSKTFRRAFAGKGA